MVVNKCFTKIFFWSLFRSLTVGPIPCRNTFVQVNNSNAAPTHLQFHSAHELLRSQPGSEAQLGVRRPSQRRKIRGESASSNLSKLVHLSRLPHKRRGNCTRLSVAIKAVCVNRGLGLSEAMAQDAGLFKHPNFFSSPQREPSRGTRAGASTGAGAAGVLTQGLGKRLPDWIQKISNPVAISNPPRFTIEPSLSATWQKFSSSPKEIFVPALSGLPDWHE